jgi:outer membrane lipoprotein carrier protein
MMKSLLSILILIWPLILKGQNDPEAIKVLDNFSATALSAPSVSLKFKLISIDQVNGTKDTIDGALLMAKDKYKLELPDNIVWFNGSVSWSYLIAEKEVTITRPDKKDDSFMSRPSSIFTLYKKGYKARLVQDNTTSYIIDLYPEDLKSELVRIRLIITKKTSSLSAAEYKRKDGTSVFLAVDDFDLSKKPDAGLFTFDNKQYSGVDVIDMR